MDLDTTQRRHIRDQAIFLGLGSIILVFPVVGMLFKEGIYTIEVIALLLGVGLSAAALRRMPGPMNWGIGISHVWEEQERQVYDYLKGLGRRGFGIIMLVEVVTGGILLYVSLRWSTWVRPEAALPTTLIMFVIGGTITMALCWLSVYLRAIASWRNQ